MQESYPNWKLGPRKGTCKDVYALMKGALGCSGECSVALAGTGSASNNRGKQSSWPAGHPFLGDAWGGRFPETSVPPRPSRCCRKVGATSSLVELPQGSLNPALSLENVSAALRGLPTAPSLPIGAALSHCRDPGSVLSIGSWDSWGFSPVCLHPDPHSSPHRRK